LIEFTAKYLSSQNGAITSTDWILVVIGLLNRVGDKHLLMGVVFLAPSTSRTTVSQKMCPKIGDSWVIWLFKAIQQVKENPLN